jgi:hypothetical protein
LGNLDLMTAGSTAAGLIGGRAACCLQHFTQVPRKFYTSDAQMMIEEIVSKGEWKEVTYDPYV